MYIIHVQCIILYTWKTWIVKHLENLLLVWSLVSHFSYCPQQRTQCFARVVLASGLTADAGPDSTLCIYLDLGLTPGNTGKCHHVVAVDESTWLSWSPIPELTRLTTAYLLSCVQSTTALALRCSDVDQQEKRLFPAFLFIFLLSTYSLLCAILPPNGQLLELHIFPVLLALLQFS